ncbi:MAG: hypothetical protein ACHREM_23550, partial [Polyangiales bacterium]
DALPHGAIVVVSSGGPKGTDLRAPSEDFVLYEDGLVLFRSPSDPRSGLKEAHLGADAVRSLVDAIIADGFLSLEQFYEVSAATDQPGVGAMVRQGREWHVVTAYGLDHLGEVTCCLWTEPPQALVATLRRIASFDVADAKPWIPGEFEMSMSDGSLHGDIVSDATERWPSFLPEPSIDPGATYARPVFDSKYLEAVDAFDRSSTGRPVLVGGRGWRFHVASYAVPERQYILTVWRGYDASRWQAQERRRKARE